MKINPEFRKIHPMFQLEGRDLIWIAVILLGWFLSHYLHQIDDALYRIVNHLENSL